MIMQSTIQLIAQFEGLVLKPYKDSGGRWTIGYGFTYLGGVPVTANTPPMTKAQADTEFGLQLQSFGTAVNKAVNVDLDQNQFDACVSLCYNIGVGGFTSSTVCREINNGNMKAATQAFMLWTKVKGVVSPTLVARRKKEMSIFSSGRTTYKVINNNNYMIITAGKRLWSVALTSIAQILVAVFGFILSPDWLPFTGGLHEAVKQYLLQHKLASFVVIALVAILDRLLRDLYNYIKVTYPSLETKTLMRRVGANPELL